MRLWGGLPGHSGARTPECSPQRCPFTPVLAHLKKQKMKLGSIEEPDTLNKQETIPQNWYLRNFITESLDLGLAGDFGQLEQEASMSLLRMEQRMWPLTEGRAGRNETPGCKCIAEKARLEKQEWKKGLKGKMQIEEKSQKANREECLKHR